MTAQKRRTQAERRTAAESKLLLAAAELVAERGAAGTSIAQISERAGFSRGIVNHHFGTRTALLERLVAATQEAFTEALPPLEGTTGLEAVLAGARVYIDALSGTDPVARAFLLLWVDAAGIVEDLRPALIQRDNQFRATVSSVVQLGIEDGSIRSDANPDAIGFALLGLLRGLGLQRFVDPAIDLAELRDAVVETIRAMLDAHRA